MSAADALVARAIGLSRESFITAAGPGGQNVNKVATAVQLRVDVFALRLSPEVFHRLKTLAGSKMTAAGEIVLTARRFRTQDANRTDARDRLAALLREAMTLPEKRTRLGQGQPGPGAAGLGRKLINRAGLSRLSAASVHTLRPRAGRRRRWVHGVH